MKNTMQRYGFLANLQEIAEKYAVFLRFP